MRDEVVVIRKVTCRCIIKILSNRFSIYGLFLLLILSLLFNMMLYIYQDQRNIQTLRSNCFSKVDEQVFRRENRKILYTNENGSTVTSDEVLLAGKQTKEQAFFTIGVPSIERNGTDYLHVTIKSLLKNVSNCNVKNIKIVILLTDTNETVKTRRLTLLKKEYDVYLTNGLIQIITIPSKAYPKLTGLVPTLGDSVVRMYWRSKQTIDFAFLMEYCRHLSPYYLQLEDDVMATQDYDIRMREFITERKDIYWFNLNFSDQGFIGKLFTSDTLRDLVRFFRLVYDQVPVDLTLFTYRNLLGNNESQTTYHKNIFLHIGSKSSALT